jgi:pyruvate dehydrogenase E1 component alpha subunit
VVAGNLTIAAGVALAFQVEGRPGAVVCVFGDGACGSGALHETLNIAAIWKLPMLLVCDNNQYSVSTPRSVALAPRRLSDLAGPFGVPGLTVDGMDVFAVRDAALGFAEGARAGDGPAFLECVSERFSSHSSATRDTRGAAELEAIRLRCPIRRLARALDASGALDADGLARLERDAAERVAEALRFADAAPYPEPTEALTDVV